jgi:hypothetical protein
MGKFTLGGRAGRGDTTTVAVFSWSSARLRLKTFRGVFVERLAAARRTK